MPVHANAAKAAASHSAGRRNMLQLIQLRWIAVIGQFTTIVVVSTGFGIDLPIPQMLTVLACLAAFNGMSVLRLRRQRTATNAELFLALLVDVASLTAQLHFSGGITNPFAFLYLLQVILGAVLLQAWSTWTIVFVTCACLLGLARFSAPLPLEQSRFGYDLYVHGLLICFALNAALLVIFITRIHDNLRTAAARLASLRQRAVEEEHIVRMGLLASGAAHELGTPLATLSVILGDWRRMPEFAGNPVLLEEIDEMEAQLKRCKSIVSGILLSAGEARGESSGKTTLVGFLDDVAAEWRTTRPVTGFHYDRRIEDDMPVVFDSALRQTLYNLLDNAFDASPQYLEMVAERNDDVLVVSINDSGPGFAPDMLAQFGKPYQSTKGRSGSGLGLFLALNVVRKLGGSLTAANRPLGGAVVRLVLPLGSIALHKETEDAA